MRERLFTYVLYIVLMLCFAWGGSTEGYAQRALKHRKGLLNADSIRAQNVADSLALLDTLNIRQKRIEELEAPVDTARLMRQSDSLQSRKPVTIKEKKKWLPTPNNSIWLSLAIPHKSHLAGPRHSRRWTNLQPQVLETAHLLWRICRLCLCPYVEQQDV